jgi:hypothetical protein
MPQWLPNSSAARSAQRWRPQYETDQLRSRRLGQRPKEVSMSGSDVPDRVRVLKDVVVATQSGTIAFSAGQVVADKHLIAALVNSDAQLETIS